MVTFLIFTFPCFIFDIKKQKKNRGCVVDSLSDLSVCPVRHCCSDVFQAINYKKPSAVKMRHRLQK